MVWIFVLSLTVAVACTYAMGALKQERGRVIVHYAGRAPDGRDNVLDGLGCVYSIAQLGQVLALLCAFGSVIAIYAHLIQNWH
jgi:hypothetical protein